MLVALARQVSLAHTCGAQRGIRKADALEAMLYAGLVDLSADIAAHERADAGRTQSDQDALAFLKMAHALLSVTALLIAQLKRDLAILAERLAALSGAWRLENTALPPAARVSIPFLDSS